MQKVIEHEPMVQTSMGVIPESALQEVNAAYPVPPKDCGPAKMNRLCPVKRSYDARCSADCALCTGTGCGIVENRMGSGTLCPLPGMTTCGDACALYVDGTCALIKRRRD